MDAKTDVFGKITERIVSILEAGQASGSITWSGQGEAGRIPYNLSTGKQYRGANVLSLWGSALEAGYASRAWLTFKQALDMGGHVRKGEKGTLGIYFDSYERDAPGDGDGEPGKRRIAFAKAFTVFNLDQVEGVDRPDPRPLERDPIKAAEDLMIASGARISEIGTRAYYDPGGDFIRLPDRYRFETKENFYVVALHELTHWTGHESRLARDLRNRFGTEAYAMEELVAELGSAFLCAETGVAGKLEHHANYAKSWLKVLKSDKRAVVTASAAAERAARFLIERKLPA